MGVAPTPGLWNQSRTQEDTLDAGLGGMQSVVREELELCNQHPRLAFDWMEIIEATNTNLRAIQ
jgi:hypothetical protein